MSEQKKQDVMKKPAGPNLFALLKPYNKWIFLLLVLTFLSNGLSIFIPKIIAGGIDGLGKGDFDLMPFVWQFWGVTATIFVISYLQILVQTHTAETVARDLRAKVSEKISQQDFIYVQNVTPAKLLTNLTSDIDGVKSFVSLAIVSIASAIFMIIGSSTMLLLTDWKLALIVLLVLPIIAVTYFVVFSKVRVLFTQGQKVIDKLNKVINESILGAALIRVLNSQTPEYQKFLEVNNESKGIGLAVLGLFASLIPVVVFVSNLATLAILMFGGYFVIHGEMTLGSFSAFNSYMTFLIFPILIIGFMSNVIARAAACYARINEVLEAPVVPQTGTRKISLTGQIDVEGLELRFGEKAALKVVSFSIKPGTRTAIVGPTAAGKTQLLYLLTGLILPTSGQIKFDGHQIDQFDREFFYKQIGIVFQDSIMFNQSIKENIAFNNTVTDESLKKAVETAELAEFVNSLPEGFETIVSERGSSLSGGQKQRIMLARALALNPKVLLLDDFTARVDAETERRVLHNVHANYPHLTLISVTQKIATVENYDQIIVLMEGEILAKGKHQELLHSSPEYVQIFNSQRSTSQYELQAE